MSYILLPLPSNPYIKQGMLQKFVHRHPLEFSAQARGSEIITTPCFEVFGFPVTAFVRAGPPLEKHATSISQMSLLPSAPLKTLPFSPRLDRPLPWTGRRGDTFPLLLEVWSARLCQMVSFRTSACSMIIFTFVLLA